MGLFSFLHFRKESQEENDYEEIMEVEDSEIYTLLEEALKGQASLSVFLKGNHTGFKSRILYVHTPSPESYLIIDLLFPEEGNEHLQCSKPLRIEYVLEGTEYVFQARFAKVAEEPVPGLKLSHPALVNSKHLRQFFRAIPPLEEPVNFSIETDAGSCISGNITDLSGGGFGFPASLVEEPIKPGTVLPNITLTFPEGDTMTAKGVLRNLSQKESAVGTRFYQYGVEFTGISETSVAKIIRYIYRLQQRQRKESIGQMA